MKRSGATRPRSIAGIAATHAVEKPREEPNIATKLSTRRRCRALSLLVPLLCSAVALADGSARDAGFALMAQGRFQEAALAFQTAVSEAEGATQQVAVLIDLGAAQAEAMRDDAALAAFRRAAEIARQEGLDGQALRAEHNVLKLHMLNLEFPPIVRTFGQHVDNILALEGDDRQGLLIAAMSLALEFETQFFEDESVRTAMLMAANAAIAEIGQVTDPSTASWAYGLMGTAHERTRNPAQAIRFTTQALRLAHEAGDPAAIFRWEWQSARLARDAGNAQGARLAYARAIEALNTARRSIPPGTRNFYERWAAPLYREFADLALAIATTVTVQDARQQLLEQARQTLEQAKQAEVENYLERECVAQPRADTAQATGQRTAVLYPVKLTDRLVVLLEVEGTLEAHVTAVSDRDWLRTIRSLRNRLEQPHSGNALTEDARRLFDWLIRPVMTTLKARNIDTLATLPEGALRTIPLSALHDGERYLIEHFAIATTPALSLTEQRALDDTGQKQTLAGGLTQSVSGFVALPNVQREMDLLAGRTRARPFLDDQFVKARMSAEVAQNDYAIAHFATHGKFEADHEDSFILLFDARWSLSEIQTALRERQQRLGTPLDLLVLSACETAAGNDRAALGLAGVAVQAGARSALASLWSVSDEATADLMDRFYTGYLQDGLGKAHSLRRAQLALIGDDRFSHPAFWAPYLLVGDWH